MYKYCLVAVVFLFCGALLVAGEDAASPSAKPSKKVEGKSWTFEPKFLHKCTSGKKGFDCKDYDVKSNTYFYFDRGKNVLGRCTEDKGCKEFDAITYESATALNITTKENIGLYVLRADLLEKKFTETNQNNNEIEIYFGDVVPYKVKAEQK